MNKLYVLALLTIGCVTVASAIPAGPEIDANSAGSALALLSGAVLVLRGRRKR